MQNKQPPPTPAAAVAPAFAAAGAAWLCTALSFPSALAAASDTADTAAKSAPQNEQNILSKSMSFLQTGQVLSPSVLLPQYLQKTAPSAISFPQC